MLESGQLGERFRHRRTAPYDRMRATAQEQVKCGQLVSALHVAISASLHLVDLLVLGGDVAEDLQFRGSRSGQASDWPRCAPCFAVR